MSIGGFARTSFSIQQGILPINVVFFGCAFMSDGANQSTATFIGKIASFDALSNVV
jgi:hypothetical protein